MGSSMGICWLYTCLSLCLSSPLYFFFLHVCSFLTPYVWFVCLCVFSVLMEQYPTEEDMIEWAKRESEREEKERLARLTQQEQEDLELAIALSKSELSWGACFASLLHWPGSARHSTAWHSPERTKAKWGLYRTDSAAPADPMKRLS